MDKVTFQTNVPVELRFQFLEGRLGESKFGGQQYMFSTDQGPFWVSETVGNIIHEQIRKQQIAVGEPVDVCKREVSQGNGRKGIQWQVSKVGFAPGEQPDGTFVLPAASKPGAGARTPAPAATGVTQSPNNTGNGINLVGAPNGNGANGHANGNGTGTDGNGNHPPVAHVPSQIQTEWAQYLIEQSNTLVDCYAACLAHASQAHGNSVKPEDVRALMTTAFIQIGGKRNGN
jgi:hypothetical protein